MKQIFINLPVKDVENAMDFYTQLGFSNNALFSDEHQKCMVWSDHIYVMLISTEKFKTYSKKDLAHKTTSAYFTLPVKSIEDVNRIVDRGLMAGGKEPNPMIDEGFMQLRRIEDLDGHIWDLMYMDLTKFKNQKHT